jgi:undecaprenyl-diphosphatase
MSLLQWLDHIDKICLALIHNDSDSSFLDTVIPILRNPYTWVPLYVFMLYYSIKKGGKKTWIFVGLSVLTFAFTDSITSDILKPLFDRPRPCYDPGLQLIMRKLVDCGGIYSMPSSHAANHVGLAAFWYWSVRSVTGKKWKWLWIWAAAICYAQIYVGKHYPFDIVIGALFGYVSGTLVAQIFIHWFSLVKRVHSIFSPPISGQAGI